MPHHCFQVIHLSKKCKAKMLPVLPEVPERADVLGQDPIHRPSLAVFEQMLPVFSHREMNDLEAMSLPASISPA
jgi:hypothetical protein